MISRTLPPDGGALTDQGVCTLRTSLVAAGFAILPEITGAKYTAKPFSAWRQRTTPFAPDLTYQNQYGLLLNTALILTGLVGIDIDLDDPSDVEMALALMVEILGPPCCLRYRSNSPRKAALYRWVGPSGLHAIAKGSDGMVELFAGPLCKLTAFGQHTDKITRIRTPLCWAQTPGNVRRDELPGITPDQADAYLAAVGDVLGDDVAVRQYVPGAAADQPAEALLASDLNELSAAAACLPNTGSLAWEQWNRVGLMLFGASGGDDRGLLAFAEWSWRNPKTRHRDVFARWEAYASCPPTRIGAGSLFLQAYQNGYRRPIGAMTPVGQPTWRERQASRALADFQLTI